VLKHFDTFLIGYQKQIGTDNYPFISGCHLPYYGIKTTGTFEEANKWWDSMIRNFSNYLGTTAYKYGDQDRGRISYKTATGYASSIKAYYIDKFRTCGPELNVFGPTKWRQLRNKLLAQFKEDTKTSGKALVNSHTASEDTDRNAIAIGCYWLGTVKSADSST
jgi:hypothetical protein